MFALDLYLATRRCLPTTSVVNRSGCAAAEMVRFSVPQRCLCCHRKLSDNGSCYAEANASLQSPQVIRGINSGLVSSSDIECDGKTEAATAFGAVDAAVRGVPYLCALMYFEIASAVGL